jgi:LmbE family N-acetylglucosaminyl deacetylase
MEEDSFSKMAAMGGTLVAVGAGLTGREPALAAGAVEGEVVVERDQPGKPHKGKVFAAIQAHLDDIPHRAAGLCAKLIGEGYTGYLIRTSNDEKCGHGSSGMNILTNEQDNMRMAKAVGFSDTFDFYYRNHRMDGISPIEIRGRLIFLFRYLKVDTVVTFNPWGHLEENPDHWVTGKAVEGACWMSGMSTHFPEHQLGGIMPHGVRERYYMVSCPGQPFNRVVDIGSYMEQKLNSLVECKSQGGGDLGSALRKQLAKQGKRLPILGNDDATADRQYVRLFLLNEYSTFAGVETYGLKYAERFFYIDQRSPEKSAVDQYVEKNAVAL